MCIETCIEWYILSIWPQDCLFWVQKVWSDMWWHFDDANVCQAYKTRWKRIHGKKEAKIGSEMYSVHVQHGVGCCRRPKWKSTFTHTPYTRTHHTHAYTRASRSLSRIGSGRQTTENSDPCTNTRKDKQRTGAHKDELEWERAHKMSRTHSKWDEEEISSYMDARTHHAVAVLVLEFSFSFFHFEFIFALPSRFGVFTVHLTLAHSHTHSSNSLSSRRLFFSGCCLFLFILCSFRSCPLCHFATIWISTSYGYIHIFRMAMVPACRVGTCILYCHKIVGTSARHFVTVPVASNCIRDHVSFFYWFNFVSPIEWANAKHIAFCSLSICIDSCIARIGKSKWTQ